MVLHGEAQKHSFETKKPKNQTKNQKVYLINQLLPYNRALLGWKVFIGLAIISNPLIIIPVLVQCSLIDTKSHRMHIYNLFFLLEYPAMPGMCKDRWRAGRLTRHNKEARDNTRGFRQKTTSDEFQTTMSRKFQATRKRQCWKSCRSFRIQVLKTHTSHKLQYAR